MTSGKQDMGKNKVLKEAVKPWQQLLPLVWIFGIAILAWRNWWWPGILVLVGIHMILEGIIRHKARQAYEKFVYEENHALSQAAMTGKPRPSSTVEPPPSAVEVRPYYLLPSTCHRCGAAVRGEEVVWTGRRSADCSFCGAALPLNKE